MPELPEVENVVRTLRDGVPSLTGRRIESVNVVWNGVFTDSSISDSVSKLEGCRCASIGRHGKYLLLGLEPSSCRNGHRLYLIIHLRMTGRLCLAPRDEAVARHTRLVLNLDQGVVLRFDDPRKFGRVWLVGDPQEILGNLGPDALTVDYDQFAERLSRYRRQLKPLLLDQSFVAGIGNIYADEILFRARLHPLAGSGDLSVLQQQLLHKAVISVLSEAVDAQGANIDGVFKQGRFVVSVYGRAGEPCFACGAAISKIRVGQRGTHICLTCQQP